MDSPVYASDPYAEHDSQFDPGELAHLVVGNRGRLLDARRTPVTVTAVMPSAGSFEVELGAFEDAGTRWELGLEEIGRFQFELDATRADFTALDALERARTQFGGELRIECDPRARDRTHARLVAEQAEAEAWINGHGETAAVNLIDCIKRRQGDPQLFALLQRFLGERGLAEIEHRFSGTFVSNPRSGEVVKGHAIALAELGLRPYRGRPVRSRALFDGAWSKPRRADHLIVRMAFVRELSAMLGLDSVTLYRGAAVDGAITPRQPGSFVSATFSRSVAEAHFEGGPTTHAALLWRGHISVKRLLMTFLETEAMNDPFREAEAVLIDGPDVM